MLLHSLLSIVRSVRFPLPRAAARRRSLQPPSRLLPVLLLTALGFLRATSLAHGEKAVALQRASAPKDAVLGADPDARGRFELSLETAYCFVPVPNPFFGLAGLYNKNPLDYELVTEMVSARYQFTGTGGPGPLRGNMEISAGFLYSTILHGPETFYAGYHMGLRYNFVPKSWPRLSQFLEVRGCLGWTDSRGFRFAQQQDFTFTYMLGAGLRYRIDRHWSVTVGVLDQHISNAYLTQPNYGFDSVGVQVGVSLRF